MRILAPAPRIRPDPRPRRSGGASDARRPRSHRPDDGDVVRRPRRAGPTAVRAAAVLLAAVTVAACAGRRSPDVEAVEPGWTQEGVASWYGPQFHGRPTASGERFDMEAMTAAHPSLPLGTRIRVTVPATGRRAELRVNDRGPFVDDRILDVSRAAARVLGFLRAGTARVHVEVLEAPPDCWEVQVGSYRDVANAREVLRRLRRRSEPARLREGPRSFTRVVAGPYRERTRAREVRAEWGGDLRACRAGGA